MRTSALADADAPATSRRVRVGTAGWSIPSRHAADFPGVGTHLQRYARRLPAVEINSSFYRPHRRSTYERWAESVPEEFQFAVKLPREITHGRRLVDVTQPLAQFLSEVGALGDKLGPLLVQLPPGLAFAESVAVAFFRCLRLHFDRQVVCEPRHSTWFTDGVDGLLSQFEIARVAADPARVPRAAVPGGWLGLAYYRLHGSPQMYYSAYGPEYLEIVAKDVLATASRTRLTWCIFDNTALGAATADALDLCRRVAQPPCP